MQIEAKDNAQMYGNSFNNKNIVNSRTMLKVSQQ